MQFDIPDGSQVSITIGYPPPPLSGAMSPLLSAPVAAPQRNKRPLLKAVTAAALLGVTFVAGQHTTWRVDPARALAAPLSSSPSSNALGGNAGGPSDHGSESGPTFAQHPYPDRPLPHSQPPLAPGQPSRDVLPAPLPGIPQVFRDTLARAPQVTPPPGMPPAPSAAAAAAPANPFGLHE